MVTHSSRISCSSNTFSCNIVRGTETRSEESVAVIGWPLGEFVPADPRVGVALVSGRVMVPLDVPHAEGGPVCPRPRFRLFMPRPSRSRKDLPRPAKEILQLIVSSTENYALPVLPIGRHVLEEIPQEEVRLSASCRATIEKLRTPVGRDGLSLWSGLGTPSYPRRFLRVRARAFPSTHQSFPWAGGQ